jgi:hypothetical protein
MGVKLSWDTVSQNVIYWQFDSQWNWDDFSQALEDAYDMGREKGQRGRENGQRVDVMVDARSTRIVPNGAFPHLKRAAEASPGNTGLIVVITESAFINALMSTLLKIYHDLGKRYRVVHSLDEARALIDEDRAGGSREASTYGNASDIPGAN